MGTLAPEQTPKEFYTEWEVIRRNDPEIENLVSHDPLVISVTAALNLVNDRFNSFSPAGRKVYGMESDMRLILMEAQCKAKITTAKRIFAGEKRD